MQFRPVSQKEGKRKNPALLGSAKWCSFSSGTLSFLFLSISLRILSLVPIWLNIRHVQSDWLVFTSKWQWGLWLSIAFLKDGFVFLAHSWCCSCVKCVVTMSGKYIIVCYCCWSTMLSQHLYTTEWNYQSLTFCHLTFFLLDKAAQILLVMLGRFQGGVENFFFVTLGLWFQKYTFFHFMLHCYSSIFLLGVM